MLQTKNLKYVNVFEKDTKKRFKKSFSRIEISENVIFGKY